MERHDRACHRLFTRVAALARCDVGSSVTKKSTLLVVGDARYARQEKSSKWKKAESLIEQGQPIRKLCESDFSKLLSQN
jgi:DNA polymerase-3 subunit epsilon